MRRVFGFAFKTLLLLIMLAVLALGAAAWLIVSKPLQSDQLAPYIEMAITRLIPGSHAQIAESTFTWDNRKHTLAITCKDVLFTDHLGSKVASFPSISLKGSIWSYLRGRVLPIELTSDGAHFWLTRHNDGSFSLGDLSSSASSDAQGIDVSSYLERIANELSLDSLKQDVSISNVQVSVLDKTVEHDWTISVPEIAIHHDLQSSTGKAKIEVTQGSSATTMAADYHYDMKQRQHALTLAFADIRLSAVAGQHPMLADLAGFDMPLGGKVTLTAERDLTLASASAILEGGAGKVELAKLWAAPQDVASLSLQLDYARVKGQILIKQFVADLGGTRLSVMGEAYAPPPKNLVWQFPRFNNAFDLTIKLENLPMDRFNAIWPKEAIPDAREWIVANLKNGTFTEGEVNLKGKVDWEDLNNSTLDKGSGHISAKDGRVSYLDGMPPIESVSAEATFNLEKMDVKILGGSYGAIKLLPFTIQMTDLDRNTQYIMLPVHLQGPVRDVLKLIDLPPLGYAKAVGINPEDAGGTVDGVLTLHMPMLSDLLLKDVGIGADAQLKDVTLVRLIPGVEVSQGNLQFKLSKDGFGLKGPVALNKIPTQLIWASRFNGNGTAKAPLHQATVTATLKDNQWGALGISDGFVIKGDVPVTLRYANVKKGFSTLSAATNLKDAAVKVDQLGWDKPVGTAAQLSFALDMPEGKNMQIKDLDLQGQGIRIKGTGELERSTMRVLSARLSPFVIGRSNATVSFEQTSDPVGPLKISVEGESFDVSGLKGEKDPVRDKPRPKEYNVNVIKFFMSDTGYFSSLKVHARRDTTGWSGIDLWGIAQGAVPVDMKLTSQNGGLVFNLQSDDFGYMLKGFGITDGVTGGSVDVHGESIANNPRAIKGKIKIGSFKVADVPLLARLFNAISPFGFIDLITGKTSFDHLRGHFVWQGDNLHLSEVRAVGSVVGLNLDGKINIDTGDANLNGTAVPFSFVNSIIGAIPLLGDVITGGDGQGVIAASFTIKDNLSDPNISVNPISLLTPGFLRNLFFGADEPENNIDVPEKPLVPEGKEAKPAK